ncbi:MAG: GNAT family N-acetyltransferase [Dehalococcoidia bacterium]
MLEAAFGGSGEANLVEELQRQGAATLALVAVLDGRVVGHILFSPVTIDSEWGSQNALGLGPMAVRPEHQNQGIGSSLLREGLKLCRERGHQIVVVLGHPAYYPRFGFRTAAPLGVRCEYDAPEEAFMVLELQPGALEGVSGVVKYRPEFSNLEE